jgi:hypothetical protein
MFRTQFLRKNISFLVPLVIAKLIADYFDNRQYEANRTFLLKMRQFICAPNQRSVNRDAVPEFKAVS